MEDTIEDEERVVEAAENNKEDEEVVVVGFFFLNPDSGFAIRAHTETQAIQVKTTKQLFNELLFFHYTSCDRIKFQY